MPRNILLLCCLFPHAVPFAASHSHPLNHNDHYHRHAAAAGSSTMGCGTGYPSIETLVGDQIRLQHRQRSEREQRQHSGKRSTRRAQFASCNDLEPQSIEIKTYFHFMAISASGDQPGYRIPHPTDVALSKGELGEYTTHDEMVAMCREQVEIMNSAFRETPFYFAFQPNPSVSTNINFTNYPMDYQHEMRETYGVKDPKALNIYLSFSLGSLKSDTTGYIGKADFPFLQLEGDGLFMRYDVLPGGGLPDNDDGYIGMLLLPKSSIVNN